MQKNILLISGFVLLQSFVSAQSIKPSVVSSGGGYFKNTEYSISYTIGELVTPTIESGSSTITQGFQQPTETSVSVAENIAKTDLFSVYPNPFSDELRIDVKTGGYSMDVMIYDLVGRQIGVTKNLYANVGETATIDTQHLTTGVYIIRLVNTERFTSSEFKVTKL